MNQQNGKVQVTPVRTFLWDGNLKHPGHPAFEVASHEAAELRANGLVADEGGEKMAAKPANKMAPNPDNKASRKRGDTRSE